MDIAGKWVREPSPLYPKVPLSTRCPNDSVVIRGAEIPLFFVFTSASFHLSHGSSSSSSSFFLLPRFFIFFFLLLLLRRQSRLGSKQRRSPFRRVPSFFPPLFLIFQPCLPVFFRSWFVEIYLIVKRKFEEECLNKDLWKMNLSIQCNVSILLG